MKADTYLLLFVPRHFTSGRSTFSNIRIYEEDRMDLKVKLFGENVTVPNVQDWLTAGSRNNQDSIDHVLSVSTDGTTVSAFGNTWRRFKLDAPFEVTPSTMLKFSFSTVHEVEGHSVCLLGDSRDVNKGHCYVTAGFDITKSTGPWRMLNPYSHDGESNDYEILIGQYFTGPVSYLGFTQDNDKVYTPSRADGERCENANKTRYIDPHFYARVLANPRRVPTPFAYRCAVPGATSSSTLFPI